MSVVVWILVSAIFFALTFYVHRHTYEADYQNGKWVADLNSPVPFPMWLLIVMLVVCFTPYLNLIGFISGAFLWIIAYCTNDIKLGGKLSKTLINLENFLNKQV